MRTIDTTLVKRILVITLTNVGDIVLTTPVVEALMEKYPDAELDVMVGPRGKEIFQFHENVRDVIIYDKKSSAWEKFLFFLMLRKRRYHIVVDLRNTVLPLVLGAEQNTSPYRHRGNRAMHKKYVHLSRLKDIGIDVSDSRFYIPMTEGDKKYVERLLEPISGKPFVVASPGAKSHVKRWPLKNFAKLCDTIHAEFAHEVVLIGDASDNIVTERMLFYLNIKPLNLVEKTNIRHLAYLVSKSKLVITNDSAPLHVASAVGAPILAFFGPTDDRQYGPLPVETNIVLRKNISCAPCKVAQCVNKEHKYECLTGISADEAFEAAKKMLQR